MLTKQTTSWLSKLKQKSSDILFSPADAIEAHIYSAYKTTELLSLHGRIVHVPSSLQSFPEHSSPLGRLHRTLSYRQMKPSVCSNAMAKVGSNEFQFETDEAGYFSFETAIEKSRSQEIKSVEIWSASNTQHALGRSLISDLSEKHTILLSDLDGTIIDNKPYEQVRLFLRSLISDAEQMKPYKNVREFFDQIEQHGIAIFYVSSSPDQLYPRLKRFLELNGFPEGPIFLKPLKSSDVKGQIEELRNNVDTKKAQMSELIGAFPDHQFILLGDDANDDIEIFEFLEKRFERQLKLVGVHRIAAHSKNQTTAKQLSYVSYKDLSLKCTDLKIFS